MGVSLRIVWMKFLMGVGLTAAVLLMFLPWHPPVGVYIAILAFLGVCVPLIREHVTPIEKAAWTGVMLVLVLLEITSIYKEQREHDREQSEARRVQLEGFQGIAQGIETSISVSQKQFAATMESLNTTVRNTLPHADFAFLGPGVNPSSLPIGIGKTLGIDIYFTNNGNDTAENFKHGQRFYIRKLHDVEAEKAMSDDFEKYWKVLKHEGGNPVPPGGGTELFSFRSEPLTETEVNGVRGGTLTFYFLVRFTWTDKTGNWVEDDCAAYQDPTRNLVVTQPCEYHTKHRYAAF